MHSKRQKACVETMFFHIGLEVIMDKLIRFSPSVTFNPYHKRTFLHIAIDSGNISNQFSVIVNISNCSKCENFFSSLSKALEKVVKVLIKNGADIHIKDNSGRTALHTAAHSGEY